MLYVCMKRQTTENEKMSGSPEYFWHYLIHFDPADRNEKCIGKTAKYSCFCDNSTEHESGAPKRTTLACDRASSVS